METIDTEHSISSFFQPAPAVPLKAGYDGPALTLGDTSSFPLEWHAHPRIRIVRLECLEFQFTPSLPIREAIRQSGADYRQQIRRGIV